MYVDDSMVLIIAWAEINMIEWWSFYSDTCSKGWEFKSSKSAVWCGNKRTMETAAQKSFLR
jgi:hypothetical protein